MSSIKCGKCAGTHESVQAVKACYANNHGPLAASTVSVTTSAAPVVQPASPKQIAFIGKLAAERGQEVSTDGLTGGRTGTASKEIERLLALPKATQSFSASAGEPEDGIYVVKGDDPVSYSYVDRQDLNPFVEDRIYKVYKMVHGSGRQGLKRLVTDGTTGSFSYLGLAAKHLPKDAVLMSLEEAKKFGRMYGFCVRCGRTLTDEGSIADGIGPVCSQKGWHAAPAIAL